MSEEAIGPDQAELYANSASYLLDSMQTRKSAGRAAPVCAVPAGLEPQAHYFAGLQAKSPLSVAPQVPSDLEWAIQKNVTLRAEIDSWRASQFQLLEKLSGE